MANLLASWGRARRGCLARNQDRDLESVEFMEPTREDYLAAARLGNLCQTSGVQLGSVDALIAQLAIRNGLALLTTDRDFVDASQVVGLRVWPTS